MHDQLNYFDKILTKYLFGELEKGLAHNIVY